MNRLLKWKYVFKSSLIKIGPSLAFIYFYFRSLNSTAQFYKNNNRWFKFWTSAQDSVLVRLFCIKFCQSKNPSGKCLNRTTPSTLIKLALALELIPFEQKAMSFESRHKLDFWEKTGLGFVELGGIRILAHSLFLK